jgi:carboxymethylenebutenolidase
VIPTTRLGDEVDKRYRFRGFENGKIASEHIYWDQATVLVQLGVLDVKHVPALGIDQSGRLLHPEAPANQLIERFK